MKNLLSAHLLDVATLHGRGFVFRQAGRPGLSLVMCFRTPAWVRAASGVVCASPGDCIVHTPDFPLEHGAAETGGGFCNDWIYADAEVCADCMRQFRLPFNELLPTGNISVMEDAVRRIMEELSHPDEWTDRSLSLLQTGMFLAIRREYSLHRRIFRDMTDVEQGYFGAFRVLRQQMLNECSAAYTIDELARNVNLSSERFAVLYPKFFGKSPYAELLDARMTRAKRLLHSGGRTLKEIAQLCGWSDVHYFSRIFKEKNGVTPGWFRQNGSAVRPAD